jgi:hypothetical protein
MSLIRSNILKIFQSTVFGTVWYLVRQQFERITVNNTTVSNIINNKNIK